MSVFCIRDTFLGSIFQQNLSSTNSFIKSLWCVFSRRKNCFYIKADVRHLQPCQRVGKIKSTKDNGEKPLEIIPDGFLQKPQTNKKYL